MSQSVSDGSPQTVPSGRSPVELQLPSMQTSSPSQKLPLSGQWVSFRHCTHVWMLVSQNGAPPHWPSFSQQSGTCVPSWQPLIPKTQAGLSQPPKRRVRGTPRSRVRGKTRNGVDRRERVARMVLEGGREQGVPGQVPAWDDRRALSFLVHLYAAGEYLRNL